MLWAVMVAVMMACKAVKTVMCSCNPALITEVANCDIRNRKSPTCHLLCNTKEWDASSKLVQLNNCKAQLQLWGNAASSATFFLREVTVWRPTSVNVNLLRMGNLQIIALPAEALEPFLKYCPILCYHVAAGNLTYRLQHLDNNWGF